jgi:hypothetical protein
VVYRQWHREVRPPLLSHHVTCTAAAYIWQHVKPGACVQPAPRYSNKPYGVESRPRPHIIMGGAAALGTSIGQAGPAPGAPALLPRPGFSFRRLVAAVARCRGAEEQGWAARRAPRPRLTFLSRVLLAHFGLIKRITCSFAAVKISKAIDPSHSVVNQAERLRGFGR